MFQHLPEPQSVIKELHRIAKDNGIVAIVDTDDAGLILFPEPEGFSRFMNNVQVKQRELGGDRFIGRKLYSFLILYFKKVNFKIIPISSKLLGNKLFINIISGYKYNILGLKQDNVLSALNSWAENEKNIGIILVFIAYGKK